MLAVLAAAAALAISSEGSSPETVRGAAPIRAAGWESVQVTVVNTEDALILRGLCLTLARRFGSRWVVARRTHGVTVPCPATASIPQTATSRSSVSLPLYDDLAPGQYRISLRYKRAAHGPDLGRLAGPEVRTAQAQLTVLSFRPGPEPRLSERRILTLALRAPTGTVMTLMINARTPASVFSVRLHRARRRLEHHLQQTTSSGVPAIQEAT
ncbi:MAG: hypothetical protein ACLP0J_10045 [Solirubrobacteraceae bacterium]|jgi:hypothetical protein